MRNSRAKDARSMVMASSSSARSGGGNQSDMDFNNTYGLNRQESASAGVGAGVDSGSSGMPRHTGDFKERKST